MNRCSGKTWHIPEHADKPLALKTKSCDINLYSMILCRRLEKFYWKIMTQSYAVMGMSKIRFLRIVRYMLDWIICTSLLLLTLRTRTSLIVAANVVVLSQHLTLFRLGGGGGHNAPSPIGSFPCCAKTVSSRLMKLYDF